MGRQSPCQFLVLPERGFKYFLSACSDGSPPDVRLRPVVGRFFRSGGRQRRFPSACAWERGKDLAGVADRAAITARWRMRKLQFEKFSKLREMALRACCGNVRRFGEEACFVSVRFLSRPNRLTVRRYCDSVAVRKLLPAFTKSVFTADNPGRARRTFYARKEAKEGWKPTRMRLG